MEDYFVPPAAGRVHMCITSVGDEGPVIQMQTTNITPSVFKQLVASIVDIDEYMLPPSVDMDTRVIIYSADKLQTRVRWMGELPERTITEILDV